MILSIWVGSYCALGLEDDEFRGNSDTNNEDGHIAW